jgi:hypothetical protein
VGSGGWRPSGNEISDGFDAIVAGFTAGDADSVAGEDFEIDFALRFHAGFHVRGDNKRGGEKRLILTVLNFEFGRQKGISGTPLPDRHGK